MERFCHSSQRHRHHVAPSLSSAGQDASNKPGDKRPDRKKHPVAQLQGGQNSRKSGGARRPAPVRQPTPNLDERRRAGKYTPIARSNMKPCHSALAGHSVWRCGAGFGDIDKTQRAVSILAAIIADLRLAQRARPVEIHGRFHAKNLSSPTRGPGEGMPDPRSAERGNRRHRLAR